MTEIGSDWYLNTEWFVRPLVPGGQAIKGSNLRTCDCKYEDKVLKYPCGGPDGTHWMGNKTQDQMRLHELNARSREYYPFDLGVDLYANGLLLSDADVTKIGENSMGEPIYHDGPCELEYWRSDHPGMLPDTWADESPGRADKSHKRGRHDLYAQNPAEPIHGSWKVAWGEILTAGILRIALVGRGGRTSRALNHCAPVIVPTGSKKELLTDATRGTGSGSGNSGGEYEDEPLDNIDPKSVVAGRNRTGYLIKWMGRYRRQGLSKWDAEKAIHGKNEELGDPIPRQPQGGHRGFDAWVQRQLSAGWNDDGTPIPLSDIYSQDDSPDWAPPPVSTSNVSGSGSKPPKPPASPPAGGSADDSGKPSPQVLIVIPQPGKPAEVARELVRREFLQDGKPLIVHWRDTWLVWDGCWNTVDEAWINYKLWSWTEQAVFEKKLKKSIRYVPWQPTVTSITNLRTALRSLQYLDEHIEFDSWLTVTTDPLCNRYSTNTEQRSRNRVSSKYVSSVTVTTVAGDLQIVELESRSVKPCVPEYFSTYATNFPYDPAAKCPEWESFLRITWPDDEPSIRLLQEWAGYLISGETCAQKMIQLIGPKRSGKSTIGRVMSQLVGEQYTVSPTLSSLCETFGLMNFPGKRLAIIADARLRANAKDVSLAVTRLLMISGEDPLDVNRKNQKFWSGPLPVRIMLLSNETPRLTDSSGTIATRFLTLQLIRSWYGQEDMELPSRLMEELPGIFNWALDGYDRLRHNKFKFTNPESSGELESEMEALSSPVKVFIRDCCDVRPDAWIPASSLYQYWSAWCKANGVPPGASNVFSRDLRAATEGVLGTRLGTFQGKRAKVITGISISTEADIPEEYLWSLNGARKLS